MGLLLALFCRWGNWGLGRYFPKVTGPVSVQEGIRSHSLTPGTKNREVVRRWGWEAKSPRRNWLLNWFWKISRWSHPGVTSQKDRENWGYGWILGSFTCSVTKSCLTLGDPTDCGTPSGLPVLHYLPGFAQVHVHCISDAIQPSHPLLPPSPPACNLFQHQGILQQDGFT